MQRSDSPPPLLFPQAEGARRVAGLEAELAALTSQLSRTREAAAAELTAVQQRATTRVTAAVEAADSAGEAARTRLEARVAEAVAQAQADAKVAARAAAARIGECRGIEYSWRSVFTL